MDEKKLNSLIMSLLKMAEEQEKPSKYNKVIAELTAAEEIKNVTTQYYFNIGERVFHDKLGVGHITDVIQIGESTMYTIDFGKMGKKAMDATYAHLKKF